jgi:hypothetical protein
MVQMLIHQRRPFHRSQRTKQAVGMLRASCGSCRREAFDQSTQSLPLRLEVPLISHQEVLVRHRIAGHPSFVDNHRFRESSQQPPDQSSRREFQPNRPLHRRSAVRQRLRRTHPSPLPLAARPELPQPPLHLIHRRRFEEILHLMNIAISSAAREVRGSERRSPSLAFCPNGAPAYANPR